MTEDGRHEEQPRAFERRYLLIDVKIRRPGEPAFPSRIADVSVTGFRLQSFKQLAVGGELWVMLPGFEARRAKILWTRAHEAGCVFDQPLHPAVLDHIVKTAK